MEGIRKSFSIQAKSKPINAKLHFNIFLSQHFVIMLDCEITNNDKIKWKIMNEKYAQMNNARKHKKDSNGNNNYSCCFKEGVWITKQKTLLCE
jgi:acetyltransferase-like isoleucine patch superfamily enzyme